MTVASAYYAELALVVLSCLVLWPLYAAQLLVFRFTSRHAWDSTRARVLCLCGLSLALQSVRAVDPSGVLGVLPLVPFHIFQQLVTCPILCAVVILAVSAAASLFKIMRKPVPRWLRPIMWSVVGVYQLETVVSLVLEAAFVYSANPGDNGHALSINSQVRNVVFIATMAFLLALWWIFFLGLYAPMKRVLARLERKEVDRVQEQRALHADLKRKEQQHANATTTCVSVVGAKLCVARIDVREVDDAGFTILGGGGGGAGFGTTPTVSHTFSRSGHSATMLASTTSSTIDIHTTTNTGSDGSPRSDTDAGSEHGEHPHAVDSKTCPSSSSASVLPSKPPLPPPRPSDSRPSLVLLRATATNGEPSYRLVEMRLAVSRFRWLTVCVTLVLIGSASGSIPSVMELANGSLETLPQADYYRVTNIFSPAMQQLSLFVAVWFCWQNTLVWRSKETRRMRGTPFWHTVLSGLDDVQAYTIADRATQATDASVLSSRHHFSPHSPNGPTRVLRPNMKRAIIGATSTPHANAAGSGGAMTEPGAMRTTGAAAAMRNARDDAGNGGVPPLVSHLLLGPQLAPFTVAEEEEEDDEDDSVSRLSSSETDLTRAPRTAGTNRTDDGSGTESGPSTARRERERAEATLLEEDPYETRIFMPSYVDVAAR